MKEALDSAENQDTDIINTLGKLENILISMDRN
jgi:hypothetical protein